MATITRFMQRPDGACNLEVELASGVCVLVQPSSGDAQEHAERTAREIAAHDMALRAADEEVERLRNALSAARTELRAARESVEAMATGEPRLFGTVLLKPTVAGDWSGPVWLLDPEKQDRGYGMRFESLASARTAFPELWPIGNTQDGVLMALVPFKKEP